MSDTLHILVWVDKNRITELNFFICNINFPDKYPLTKTLRVGAEHDAYAILTRSNSQNIINIAKVDIINILSI